MKYLLALGFLGMASAFQPADHHYLYAAVNACINVNAAGDCCRAVDGTFSDAGGQPCASGVHISEWDTSLVTDFSGLFRHRTQFNQNLGAWDTSLVTTFQDMFWNANLYANDDQPLNWNTSSATVMSGMFQYNSGFNQCLCGWDTSKVTTMVTMFYSGDAADNRQSSFNQDISCWDVSSVTDFTLMFGNGGLMAQTLCWDDATGSNVPSNVDATCTSTGCVVPAPPDNSGSEAAGGGCTFPDCNCDTPAQYIDAQCCQCS